MTSGAPNAGGFTVMRSAQTAIHRAIAHGHTGRKHGAPVVAQRTAMSVRHHEWVVVERSHEMRSAGARAEVAYAEYRRAVKFLNACPAAPSARQRVAKLTGHVPSRPRRQELGHVNTRGFGTRADSALKFSRCFPIPVQTAVHLDAVQMAHLAGGPGNGQGVVHGNQCSECVPSRFLRFAR